MRQIRNISIVINEVLNELDGLAYGPSSVWLEKDRNFFEERYSRIFSLFPEIKKKEIGLEVGLHHGIIAYLVKRIFQVNKLYALEHPATCKQFAKTYLDKLKKNKIILEPCDLRVDRLPWPDSFFDYVIFSEVMEHLIPAAIPSVIRQINGVLKKDKWLLVTTPNIAALLKRINLLFGKNPNEFDLRFHGETYGHIREYTMQELTTVLQQEGFKIAKKGYFSIDSKRNIFTYLEYIFAKVFPSFSTNLWVLARKV